MAEGGGDFVFYDPKLDRAINNDTYDDDDEQKVDNDPNDDDDEQEVNRTQPFQPGASSTPYHGWEQHEMQAMQHE